MKNAIILAVSFFLLANTRCQILPDTPMPTFPEEIKYFYVLDMAADPVAMDEAFTSKVENPEDLPQVYAMSVDFSCLKLEITSKHPFLLKYLHVTDPRDCRAVGGYQPDDHELFYNFVDDSQSWMKFKESQCTP